MSEKVVEMPSPEPAPHDPPGGNDLPPLSLPDLLDAQQARQATEETYRAIFEACSDAIFLHDAATGQILDINPRTAELFGWTADEFRTLDVIDISTGEPPYTQANAVARIRAATVEPQTFVWHCRSRQGRTFWVDVTLRRALIGDLWRILAFVRDVSERVEAAQARDRLLQQEHLARIAAEEAVSLRETFISIASHELKSPLTAMTYSLHVLKRMVTAPDEDCLPVEPVHRFVMRAERQCRRLNQHINMLLDISRIQSQQLHLHRESVDLCALAARCVEDLADDGTPATSPITVTTDGPVVGVWDGTRLEQVVFNLLSNARKYGQGRPIEVACRRVGSEAVLTVTDHGIGIAPDAQATIFDRFVRAVSPDHFGGLGLGLYIARTIVHAHQGTITVASRPGQGSTFTVTLPLAPPAAANA